MAIEKITLVNNVESRQDKKGNDYSRVTITGDDGKEHGYAVYDSDIIGAIRNAFNMDQPVVITLDKVGNFWNIVGVKLATGQLPSAEQQVKETVPPAQPTNRFIAPEEKGMWWKEIGENFRTKLFDKDDKANGTLLWRAYILQMMTSLELEFNKEKEDNN